MLRTLKVVYINDGVLQFHIVSRSSKTMAFTNSSRPHDKTPVVTNMRPLDPWLKPRDSSLRRGSRDSISNFDSQILFLDHYSYDSYIYIGCGPLPGCQSQMKV